jgi:hypothetical protein
MMRKLSMAVGVAVGYVLGTRAGRERYRQIMDRARELVDRPAVAKVQAKVTHLLGTDDDSATDASSATQQAVSPSRSAKVKPETAGRPPVPAASSKNSNPAV